MKSFIDQTGSPPGASTIAGRDRSRQVSQVELEGARYQGKYVAQMEAGDREAAQQA